MSISQFSDQNCESILSSKSTGWSNNSAMFEPSWSDRAILTFSSQLILSVYMIFSHNHSLHQYHLCQQARAPYCWVLALTHEEPNCVKKWGESPSWSLQDLPKSFIHFLITITDDLSRWILDSWFDADCKLHQGYSSIRCLQQSSWHPSCLCAIKICSRHETKTDDYLCQLQCRRFHLRTVGPARPSHALHKNLRIYIQSGYLRTMIQEKRPLNLIQTYVSVGNILVTILPHLSISWLSMSWFTYPGSIKHMSSDSLEFPHPSIRILDCFSGRSS